ncbi:MAG: ABC transporter permease [Thaumarchaeota archaeon]|nr:ABC transporter permease [Nitrososphaerota archaeon]
MDLTPVVLGAFFGLQYAVVIGIAAQGELLTEKSGILNIGIQGVLTFSAFTAGVSNFYLGPKIGTLSPYGGLVVGMATGIAVNFFFAFLSTHLKVDQVIAGIGVSLLAGGITEMLLLTRFTVNGTPSADSVAPLFTIKGLASGVSISISPFIFALFLIPGVTYLILSRTKLGLRARAVGENPKAAEVAGISVARTRLLATSVGGALLGLAGSYRSVDFFNYYDPNFYFSGLGFIALAAVIAGGWNPPYVLGVSLLFGFSLGLIPVSGVTTGPPFYFITMLPYITTVVVLAVASKRLRPPAALAQAYKKE